MFSLIGIMVLVAFSYIPFRLYRLLTYPALAVALVMLVAVAFTGLGVTAGGSARWLQIGPIRFQPSELARMALVVYMAYSMSKKDELLRDFYVGFCPISWSWAFLRHCCWFNPISGQWSSLPP
jgi:cell division protein FtsW